PSYGSVPAPSSSNKTTDSSSTCSIMDTIFDICDENVLKFCSIDCSSPISANTSEKTAIWQPSSAGTCKPDWTIKVHKPTIFNVTVVPPVFGPVITIVVYV